MEKLMVASMAGMKAEWLDWTMDWLLDAMRALSTVELMAVEMDL